MSLTAREKLIKSASELMNSTDDIEKITSREITSHAGINLALINYHFGSKENLLRAVMAERMSQKVAQIIEDFDISLTPMEKIKLLLLSTATFAFENTKYFSVISSHEISLGCVHSMELFMPFFKLHFKDLTNEILHLKVLRLLITYHTVLINPIEYGKILNVDFFDPNQRDSFICQLLDII